MRLRSTWVERRGGSVNATTTPTTNTTSSDSALDALNYYSYYYRHSNSNSNRNIIVSDDTTFSSNVIRPRGGISSAWIQESNEFNPMEVNGGNIEVPDHQVPRFAFRG
jgi:hypothetical protein